MVIDLGKFNRYLYDEIGREYERKNLYLAELAEIDELLQNRDKDKTHLRKKRRELITGRDKHPYIVQLKELSRSEREFKNRLKSEVSEKTY